MNSATWIMIGMKLLGWLKKPSTYWKARKYINKKEKEDEKSKADALRFANRE